MTSPGIIRLHEEITRFHQLYLCHNEEEAQLREWLIECIDQCVKSTFPHDDISVTVFGSQSTGLCGPFSDIDICVQHR
jgi:DNA polymerase sigma